jgi:Flp pilus assembly protein TadD
LRPDLGVNLATALRNSGRDEEGLLLLSQLVSETPTNSYLHRHLAYALMEKRQLDEAVAEYRKAVALDPKNAWIHFKLGFALRDKGQLDEAVAEYRQAIELDPKNAMAHANLGIALSKKGQWDEAVAEFRQALALDAKDANAHANLGIALSNKGQWDEAVAELRQAIALDPKDAQYHANLGFALSKKGQWDEAVAEFRQALALDLNDAQAHYVLGNALKDKGQWDEAVAEFRQAIRLKPDFAEAHCNLAIVLTNQGHFDEALAFMRLGHQLGSKQPGWPYPSAQWVRDAEQLLVLDKKLPAILSGEQAPANPGEAAALARLCAKYKKLNIFATHLFGDAFAADPQLAADWMQWHRYNAACSAALAAAGQGNDAQALPEKTVAQVRRQALRWLRDDLAAYAKVAEQNHPDQKQIIQQRLAHWRGDPDFASVRGPQALERLPENERADWQSLWRDVDELLTRAAKKDEPTQGREKLQTPTAKP